MHSPLAAPAPPWAVLRAAAIAGGLIAGGAWTWLVLASLACGDLNVPKGPGEPCTRTSECQIGLACTSGVCRAVDLDAGDRRDAFTPRESGVDALLVEDADLDVSIPADADLDAAIDLDASEDAAVLDDADLDASEPEADIGASDASADDAPDGT